MRRVTITLSILLGVSVAAGPALSTGPPFREPASPARGTLEKTLEGRVTEYTVGRTLTVTMDDERTFKVRLDEKDPETKIPPDLAVGSRVRVIDSRRADGKRTVSVALANRSASRS